VSGNTSVAPSRGGTRLPRRLVLLVAVAALAVPGCGGSDSDSEAPVARDDARGQVDTTRPQTGTSGATQTQRARSERAAKTKQQSKGKTGGAEGKTRPAAPAAPTGEKKEPKPYTLTPEQLKEVGQGMYEQARVLCKAVGLEPLAQHHGIKSGDPDDVAEAYAADYLAGLRNEVAAGCKAGLLESK
jgi:hypothetical protein